jgi:hypothetical protein
MPAEPLPQSVKIHLSGDSPSDELAILPFELETPGRWEIAEQRAVEGTVRLLIWSYRRALRCCANTLHVEDVLPVIDLEA